MKHLIIITLALTLFSCKAYKEKILAKYCKQDTLVYRDTVRTSSVKIDTAFVDHYMTDTLVLTKEKLVIRYIKKDSLIYFDGECLPDTFIREIKIPFTAPQPVLSRWDRAWIAIRSYFAFIGILAILFVLVMLLFKK